MADLDATLVEEVLNVAQGQRKPDLIIAARRMISGLVLKDLQGERLVIATG
jgi:hypothetical protein